MSRNSCVGLAFAFALASTAPAAAVGEFSSGSWKGWARFEGSKFVHCAMWAPYINRWDLLFAVNPVGELQVGLRSQKIDMTPAMIFGQKAALRMQVDDDPVVIKAFTTLNPTTVATMFAPKDEWIGQLRTGKALRINTGRKVLRFPLKGLKEALATLQACTAKHRTT